jgi:hypothetical protein
MIVKRKVNGRYIAERELTCVSDPNKRVTVRLGPPMPSAHGDYECSYELVGPDVKVTRLAAGLDAIHAIQLALVAIGGHVSAIEGRWGDRLEWQDGGSGFPKP